MADQKDLKTEKGLSLKGATEGFLGGDYISYVFKKTEKLTKALYMISNHWGDKEPLKWSLRNRNIKLLETASSYHYSSIGGKSEIRQNLSSRIAEIVYLLNLTYSSGLISEMNFRILREEYMGLISLLGSDKIKESFSLNNKSFDVGEEPQKIPASSEFAGIKSYSSESYKGHKGQIKDISNKMSFRKPKDKISKDKEVESNHRRESIIKLLKNKGEISVKDAAGVLNGVSEKTVQRELSRMTDEGLIEKKGERRWSRYYLKN